MAKLTPEEFQEKHARRLKASIPDIEKGIGKVTEAPTAKAAAKSDKMRARLLARIDDGTWASRLRGVSLEDWKSKAIAKGVPRIASGIDGASAKVKDFAGQLLPHIDKVQAEVKKMPDLTLEDSINRMSTFVRGMSKFRKK
jgi:hypothetical protein